MRSDRKPFSWKTLLALCVSIFVSFLGYAQQAERKNALAIKDYESLLNSATQTKDHAKASLYSYEIAKLYEEQNQPEKAVDHFSRCLMYSKKSGDNTLMYFAYQSIGMIYAQTENPRKALDNFQSSLKTAQQINKPLFIYESLIQIANVHGSSGRYKKALEPLEKALAIAVEQGDFSMKQKCYQLLAEYHDRNGNKIKSDEYAGLMNVNSLKQQASRAGQEKEASQTQLRIQTERLKKTEESLREIEAIREMQQMEIDLLNKSKELADLRIKEQNAYIKHEELLRNSIIVVALLAGALVTVLFSSYRKKLKINHKIDQQNKNIKSSINYAKRIQEAMLPKKDQQQSLGADSFIFFRPRDTVSGDFYWFSKIKNSNSHDQTDAIAFAAVDCTGHGVPGAFMSMIGINALNGIISRGIAETNQILDTLHVEIRTALRQEVTGNNDGMDVGLCVYRREKKLLEFSGAKNPLVYVQNNELFRIKGDVHPIGGSKNKAYLSFKKHEITIDKPTMIYLFTDGYRDQFGGKDNMKFMSKRFNDLLLEIHQLPMDDQMHRLDSAINEWKGNGDQTDDILVMGIRLE